MNEEIHLIDSNILVYAYDVSEGKKHKLARELLEDCFRGEINYAVSTQNLSEFFNIITTKVEKPLNEDEAINIIQDIIEFPGFLILRYDETTIISAIRAKKKFKKHYWDLLIIATMKQHAISKIYTENLKDFNISGIEAVNPF